MTVSKKRTRKRVVYVVERLVRYEESEVVRAHSTNARAERYIRDQRKAAKGRPTLEAYEYQVTRLVVDGE
jgi:hypothetical protein